MRKLPCSSSSSSKEGIKRGPWTAEEDEILANFVRREGEGQWRTLPKRAGLLRCGKSCRLRWMNYLRPCVKRGRIAPDEEDLILRLHRLLGNRWSLIAGRIPGRTDNEIKNYWNTHLSKKLINQGIDPRTHKPLNPNFDIPEEAVVVASSSSYCNHITFSNPNPNPKPIPISSKETEEKLDQSQNHGSKDEGLLESCTQIISNIGNINNSNEMEDAFSSFLESLINEDAAVQQPIVPSFDYVTQLGWDYAGLWEADLGYQDHQQQQSTHYNNTNL